MHVALERLIKLVLSAGCTRKVD